MIGRAIKYVRNAAEWSQDDLAKRTGLTNGWLSKIEAGHLPPGQQTITKVTDAFGCTPGDLIKFSECMSDDPHGNLEMYEKYFGGMN